MLRRSPLLRKAELKAKRRKSDVPDWLFGTAKACAQCGEDFRPERTTQRFCSQKCFGASRVLPPLTCERCGEPRPDGRKHPSRRFCSRKCAAEAATLPPSLCSVCQKVITPGAKECNEHRHVPNRRSRAKQCPTCTKTFYPEPGDLMRALGKYCSKACYFAVRALRPAFVAVQCEQCGTTFRRTRAAITRRSRTFCSKRCSGIARSGEGNEMYRGGHTQRRGAGWTVARRDCRERDKVCRSCGKTPEENGQALSVDHLIPWRLFSDELVANSLDNLVALCRVCHGKKTGRAESAYVRGDILDWLTFLRDVQVDPGTMIQFEPYLMVKGKAA